VFYLLILFRSNLSGPQSKDSLLYDMADIVGVLVRSKPVFVSLALCTHYILHSGEVDYYTRAFLVTWCLGFSGIAAAEYRFDPQARTLTAAIQITAIAAIVYFSTLTASVLIYRGFFHRLHRVQ
jgi:hypothetical protein